MTIARLLPIALLTLAIATRAVTAQSTAALPDTLLPRIDAVFARYARTDAPGCALGVYRDGAVAYAKGYGSANIEYGVPITPTTPFISGSLSKQFTAAAIALLVEQGRLSPDDDVRKYVPELPDYGTPITIAHLVHHTSGLRDFWSLVQTAGMRPDDGYTVGDVLAIATRQKRLNFSPGTDYNYSNTGYVVMGVVVQRVTGKSLREFADEQIFGPLGMKNTHYHDDHTMPVAGRAAAYSPSSRGWRINIWNNDIVGQGGVMTTIEDLARWDENFYTGRVGGPGFLARQLQRGKLTNDSTLAYAYGLTVGEYRGLPVVEHGGSTGGYRTVLTRFPAARTSVAALCNVATANPTALARRVADIVLASSFTKPAPPASAGGGGAAGSPNARAAATLSAADLAPLAGRYYSSELDATFELTAAGGSLLLRRPRSDADTLRAADPRTFRAGPLTLRFPPGATRAAAAGFTVDIGRARGMEFVRTEER